MTNETPLQRAQRRKAARNRQIARRRRLVGRGLPTLLVVGVVVILLGRLLFGGSPNTKPPQSHSTGQNIAATSPTTKAVGSHADNPVQPTPTGLTPAVKTNLTSTLTNYVAGRTGQAAVGVLDLKTGATYCFHCEHEFVTASIVKVDILEALLLRAQQHGQPISADERALAVRMIENSDNDAASSLYYADDDDDGINAANRTLGLSHTTVAGGGVWGDTETTVTDQLVLLRNITSSSSPLTASNRSYIKGLMSNVESDQRWGVPAAAGGRAYLVKNGWLPRTIPAPNWTVNSDGVILAGHHDDPVAVSTLTARDPTMGYGIATVEHMAKLVVAPLIRKTTRA